ncbi:MAG: sensor histidine kinase [Clostridia bacterium]|nr:sensor histidine kinase [Clostridia bacterium]
MNYWLFLYGHAVYMLNLMAHGFSFARTFTMRDKRLLPVVLALCAAVVCLFSFLIHWIAARYYLNHLIFFAAFTLNYFVVLVFWILSLRILYKEPLLSILFCGIISYVCAYVENNVATILDITFDLYYFLEGRDGATFFWYYAVQLIVSVAIYLPMYFFYYRKLLKSSAKIIKGTEVNLCFALTIFALFFMSFVRDWCFSSYSESVVVEIVFRTFSVACGVFILFIYSGILSKNYFCAEVDTVRTLWEKDRSQYALLKENVEIINLKCHDLRKRIDLLENHRESVSEREIQTLREAINVYDSRCSTGNSALDTILTEYMLICEKKGILFTCTVDGSLFSFLDEADLFSFFSNAVTNAIEAVESLPEEEKKVISVIAERRQGFLSVVIENYFEGGLVMQDGLPRTKKADVSSHGFGVKSMKNLVERYNGTISFSVEGELFLLTALFPIP